MGDAADDLRWAIEESRDSHYRGECDEYCEWCLREMEKAHLARECDPRECPFCSGDLEVEFR